MPDTVTLNEYNRLVEKSKGLDELLHGLKCLARSESQLTKLRNSGRVPRDIIRTMERERGMIRIETLKKLASILELVAKDSGDQTDIMDAVELAVGKTDIRPSNMGAALAEDLDEPEPEPPNDWETPETARVAIRNYQRLMEAERLERTAVVPPTLDIGRYLGGTDWDRVVAATTTTYTAPVTFHWDPFDGPLTGIAGR